MSNWREVPILTVQEASKLSKDQRSIESDKRLDVAIIAFQSGATEQEVAEHLGYKYTDSLRSSLISKRSYSVANRAFLPRADQEITSRENIMKRDWNRILYSMPLRYAS